MLLNRLGYSTVNFYRSVPETTVKLRDKFTHMFIAKLAGLQLPSFVAFKEAVYLSEFRFEQVGILLYDFAKIISLY
jgi:hypothetical protein